MGTRQLSFGIENLPYASVVGADGRRRAVVRFGDAVLDLCLVDAALFRAGTLDAFLAAGRETWDHVRSRAAETITADRFPLTPLTDVTPVLGFIVADYVDFYASEQHATNAGRIFRPDGAALPPNWKHVPIGYHGRASSLLVSGTPVRRPSGMLGPGEYGPSQRLDFEAEVAFVVGSPGRHIAVDDADEHVFGLCLLNDWSARDIQAFETVPLGPFLGKAFATTVSPWITPLSALAQARVAPPRAEDDPIPVRHLRDVARNGFDIDIEIAVNGHVISRPSFADMYWTYAQMLAHLTSNGAHVRTGDVFASGTVSGPGRDQRGCLLELTWNGTEPLDVGGESRNWLADGDLVEIRGASGRISLGTTLGEIVGE